MYHVSRTDTTVSWSGMVILLYLLKTIRIRSPIWMLCIGLTLIDGLEPYNPKWKVSTGSQRDTCTVHLVAKGYRRHCGMTMMRCSPCGNARVHSDYACLGCILWLWDLAHGCPNSFSFWKAVVGGVCDTAWIIHIHMQTSKINLWTIACLSELVQVIW